MRISTALVLATALLAQAGPAWSAMTPQQEAEYRKNCTADYTRLCSQFKPDSAEVRVCFQQKMSQVSARCQQTLARFQG